MKTITFMAKLQYKMLKSIYFFLIALLFLISCKSKPYATFTPSQKISFSEIGLHKNIKQSDSLTKIVPNEQPKTAEISSSPFENLTSKKEELSASSQSQNISFNKVLSPKTETKFTVKPKQSPTKDKPKVNTLAIVSVGLIGSLIVATILGVLSMIGGLPILILTLGSLITGIVALSKIKKKQESGKSLAITGIVLSSLFILFLGLVIAAISSLH
jgi:hypothetical protein